MKRIYNTFFAVTALLVFAPVAHGQYSINEVIPGLTWPKQDVNVLQQSADTDFAYRKDISAPQSDGTYWIQLESFSTGAATKILTSTPSDIILVLDSSTSMNTNDYPSYTARPSAEYSYNSYGNNTYYYKHTDGNYYAVQRGGTYSSNGNRRLWFEVNGTIWYLSGTGGATQTQPAGVGNNAPIWTGVLYTRGNQTRINALRTATNEFIDTIYQNDYDVTDQNHNYPGNRIAIVTYDNEAHVLTDGWVDVGGTGAVAALKSAVNGISLANWTRPALGMSSAISNFLAGPDADHQKREVANLTVVMFTDGVPAHSQGTGNTFEAVDANAAIYYGYRLKHDYKATLFTVGLLNASSTDNNIRRGIRFLDLLSSNYPESYIAQDSNSAWNINGNNITVNGMTGASATDKVSEDCFQLVDENTNLSSIFDSIAQQSGGSSSALSAASRNVDVVSNSFILPEGTTAANIGEKVKIFIAKVNGFTYDSATQKYACTFGTEIQTGHIPTLDPPSLDGYYYYPLDEDGNRIQPEVLTKVDTGISIAYNETTQAVTVTGFDYSSCFCGPIFEQDYPKNDPPSLDDLNHATFQGFKIIIMIPIHMNPEAVGGPDVNTNGAGSGIFVSSEGGDALVAFKSPTVSLPVNIHLKKTGLGAGESAKFKIERAQLPDPLPENFNPATLTEWYYVSTVFVTKPQGSSSTDPDPVVKVRGLPANMDVTENGQTVHRSFVYRITEENWSWSYDAQTPPQYTTTSNVTNPFTFDNMKQDNIDVKVRHAESKATNVFKPGVVTNNVKYDDSKDNGR